MRSLVYSFIQYIIFMRLKLNFEIYLNNFTTKTFHSNHNINNDLGYILFIYRKPI